MSVYIIRVGQSNLVKIGVAKNVMSRMATLQTGHHDELSLLRVVDGDCTVERWFHREFKHCRRRREWFEFDPAMLTVVLGKLGEPRKTILSHVENEQEQYWNVIRILLPNIKQEALRKAKSRGRVPSAWHIPILDAVAKCQVHWTSKEFNLLKDFLKTSKNGKSA